MAKVPNSFFCGERFLFGARAGSTASSQPEYIHKRNNSRCHFAMCLLAVVFISNPPTVGPVPAPREGSGVGGLREKRYKVVMQLRCH